MSPLPPNMRSANALVEMLQAMLAKELKLDVQDIDPTQAFTAYGLDSLAAVTIVSDLEDLLDTELPQTLLWDYPSVERLAAHLLEVAQATTLEV